MTIVAHTFFQIADVLPPNDVAKVPTTLRIQECAKFIAQNIAAAKGRNLLRLVPYVLGDMLIDQPLKPLI